MLTKLATVLSGTSTDGLGQDVDGSGDFGTSGTLGFAADGFSDLIVGNNGGTSVNVYFGSATGYSNTPSIKITGATGTVELVPFVRALVPEVDLAGGPLTIDPPDGMFTADPAPDRER